MGEDPLRRRTVNPVSNVSTGSAGTSGSGNASGGTDSARASGQADRTPAFCHYDGDNSVFSSAPPVPASTPRRPPPQGRFYDFDTNLMKFVQRKPAKTSGAGYGQTGGEDARRGVKRGRDDGGRPQSDASRNTPEPQAPPVTTSNNTRVKSGGRPRARHQETAPKRSGQKAEERKGGGSTDLLSDFRQHYPELFTMSTLASGAADDFEGELEEILDQSRFSTLMRVGTPANILTLLRTLLAQPEVTAEDVTPRESKAEMPHGDGDAVNNCRVSRGQGEPDEAATLRSNRFVDTSWVNQYENKEYYGEIKILVELIKYEMPTIWDMITGDLSEKIVDFEVAPVGMTSFGEKTTDVKELSNILFIEKERIDCFVKAFLLEGTVRCLRSIAAGELYDENDRYDPERHIALISSTRLAVGREIYQSILVTEFVSPSFERRNEFEKILIPVLLNLLGSSDLKSAGREFLASAKRIWPNVPEFGEALTSSDKLVGKAWSYVDTVSVQISKRMNELFGSNENIGIIKDIMYYYYICAEKSSDQLAVDRPTPYAGNSCPVEPAVLCQALMNICAIADGRPTS